MNNTHCMKLGITRCGAVVLVGVPAKADTFGSGANAFTIDLTSIGNAGNPDDTVTADDGSDLHFGGVGYAYRIATNAFPQVAIDAVTNLGLAHVTAGAWTGSQPAANISWYQAAALVNWLNTSTGHQPAYQLFYSPGGPFTSPGWNMNLWASAQAWQVGGENLYRNKDAYYFLPSEDEYYKAAYHKNDGTGNFWKYATGSNTLPTAVASGTAPGTAVYNGVGISPATVEEAGGLSPYGTVGQTGNVYEWMESAYNGSNTSEVAARTWRGGDWRENGYSLASTDRFGWRPDGYFNNVSFRVASVAIVPEPSSSLLLLGTGWMWRLRRRR